MTDSHDQMCLRVVDVRSNPNPCVCWMIRAVRAEEREQVTAEWVTHCNRVEGRTYAAAVDEAIQRVERLPVVSSGIGMKDDALAALAEMKEGK